MVGIERAAQWIRATDGFAQRFGSPHLYTTCRTYYGAVLYATGNWAEAERQLHAAIESARTADRALHEEALARLAELRLAQGRIDEAERLLEASRTTRLPRHPWPGSGSSWARRRPPRPSFAAACASWTGRSGRGPIRPGRPPRSSGRHCSSSSRRRGSNRGPPATPVLPPMPWPSWAPGPDASRRRHGGTAAGRVLAAAGEPEAAVAELERALAIFARLGLPYESARTHLAIAKTVPNDPAAAREGRAALAAFERLGAGRDADDAAALLRSLGVAAARTGGRGAGALTRREREVLELLAEGHSNREIAARLFLTRKTVEHHVRNVLQKLGLRSRAEAAAYAVRHLEHGSASTSGF